MTELHNISHDQEKTDTCTDESNYDTIGGKGNLYETSPCRNGKMDMYVICKFAVIVAGCLYII